jgi:hypothetical protein
MIFTIAVRCASGHTALQSLDLPGREWADELSRIFGKKGKCETCDAPLTLTVGTPTDQN